MTEQQINEAVSMWKSGKSCLDIINTLGVTMGSFNHLRRMREDLFSRRMRAGFRGKVKDAIHINRGETMTWVTHAGAHVTLPRVRFLEKSA